MTTRRNRKTIAAHSKGIESLIKAKVNKQNYKTGKLWNYTDIRTETGIGTKTISKFFRGIAIELENAVAIAQALDLDIKDIVDRDEYQRLTVAKPKSTSNHKIDWREVCRQMLEKHPLRQKATEEDFELDIYIPLGLMERKQQQRRPANQDVPMEEVYKLEEKEEITRRFKHNQFLEHIGLRTKPVENTKNIAIIGEPGAGKSTLLEKIAKEIDEQNKGLPICISLANLEGLTLEEYLEQKWLKDALPTIQELAPTAELSVRNVPEELKENLAEEFTNTQQGGIWLLLDGLDEMKETSPSEALNTIEKQIGSGYLAKARVVLSCRLNVWDANLTNPFSKFDKYRTLEFEDFQRDDVIQQWFNKKNKLWLATDLISKLKETGKEGIRELVKNPLRLVLLCRIWTLNQGKLPETKAELYERLTNYFYEWKSENIPVKLRDYHKKKKKLHKALSKLAVAGIDSGARFRLKSKFACDKMGEKLFKLACNVSWLNVVDRDTKDDQKVYAFFHPTFQEYFAARAIDDWDFFLPRNHIDKPVKDKKYRIFEPKWKEVILLWLGRGDIVKEEKEDFITALVEFKDGCSPVKSEIINRGFYQYRAYFLAAAGVNELKKCSRTKEIVTQVVYWSFSNLFWDIKISATTTLEETNRTEVISVLVDVIESNKDESTLSSAAVRLGKFAVGNKRAISALVKLITSTKNEFALGSVAFSLGQIAVGNQKEKAISALVELITSTSDKSARTHAAISLGQIDPGNEKAISALVKLITSTSDESTLSSTAFSLESIGVGNEKAISPLVKLITSASDKSARRRLVDTLGFIGVGNEKAISFLVQLIVSNSDKSTRIGAAFSLEKIGVGNEKVISALVQLIDSASDKESLSIAAMCLGKIGVGNKMAISALVQLITSTKNEFTPTHVFESLGKIGVENKMAISTLVNLIDSIRYEYIRGKAAICLGKIDPGNGKAISALVELIDSYTYRPISIEAARSLGQIDPGNDKAISALVELIDSTRYESIRRKAVESLGQIGVGNKMAISILVKLIDFPRDKFTLVSAARSLGQIDPGNDKAILTLVKLIDSTSDEFIRDKAVESLEEILIKSLMPTVVNSLKNNTNRKAVKIMGQCAQNLSYPEFYLAWHS